MKQLLSRSVCRSIAIFCAWLCCLSGTAFAEWPEFGGPKKFDLICRGRDTVILKPYLPRHMAGSGKETPDVQAARNHIMIDLVSMQFLELGKYHPMKIPRVEEGIAYLYDQHGFRFWTIDLDTYKSVFVSEEMDGEISVEKMNCRLAPFSGFPFVPSSVEDVRKIMRKK